MSAPVKAIIVEDEAPAMRMLKQSLSAYEQLIDLVGVADSGTEAVAMINLLKPDVVFLDIQLQDITGFDVLKQLSYQPFVIFTTAYDDYAIKAFESLSVDYLLKPIKSERLLKAIGKLQHFINGKSLGGNWNELEKTIEIANAGGNIKTLPVKKGNKFVLVQLADILYIEAYDKYSFVYTSNDEKFFCDYMLANLEEKLSADFTRIQKSYIVNSVKVLEVHKYSNNRFAMVLNDKNLTRLVTGPTYYQAIKERFGI